MKFITLSAVLFFCLSFNICFAGNSKTAELRIDDDVSMVTFRIGKSGSSHFYYIVIGTTNQCFLKYGGGTSGHLSQVDCEPLKKIPRIKTYLETFK